MKTGRKRAHRRSPFRYIAAVLLVLAGIWYINTFTLKTTEIAVADEKIKGEVKIVQISDLHGASFGRSNSRLIRKIQKQKPDLVFATGDMYTYGDDKGRQTAYELLAALAEEFPVYFVNGEHDKAESFAEQLREAGVQVLDYKTEQLTVNGTELTLYGIDNVYYSPTFDLANEFTVDEDRYNILLAHIENSPAFSDFGIDLAFCGDTHGGQVRLPLIGAVYNRGIWFPEIGGGGDTACTKGLYEKDGCKIFVSSGLGNFPLPIRLFNRPEIAVITLKPVSET